MTDTLTLVIKVHDRDRVTDALNEVLSELADRGAVDDTDDHGWEYK